MTSKIMIDFKPWETKYFGLKVYNIDYLIDDGDYKTRFEDTIKLTSKTNYEKRYEYCLINSSDIPVINALESMGFKYLVATVELESYVHPDIESTYMRSPDVSIVRDDEISKLEEIAHTSFSTGRLYAEYPRVDMNAMHSEWIRNCCTGTQAEKVFVSHDIDGSPTGFIAIKHNGNIGDIVLIAVDKNSRRFGYGSSLLYETMNWANELKLERVIVRTELTNIAAVKLYESYKFRFTGGGIYLGRWIE